MRRRRSSALIAAVLATAAGLATVFAPAAVPAAAVRAAPGDPSITLTGQPAWSTLGDDLTFRLALTSGPTLALEVRAIFYSAVLSRIAFERSLDGERLGRDVVSRSIPVTAMPVVGTDHLFTIGLQDPAAPSDSSRVRLSLPASGNAGVFPVRLQLRESESGRVLDDFVTEVVAIRRRATGATPSEPLQVAWLWNVAAPPIAPTGAVTPRFTADLAPRGRLGRLGAALGAIGDLAVTVVPNPATVDALGTAAATDPNAATVLGSLRTASRSALALSGPYAILDGPSLLQARLTGPFAAAMTTGRSALESGLNAAVDPTIAGVQPLDEPTLTELRRREGTTRIVVEPDALAAADGPDQFTPARPFRIDTAGGSFDALEVNRLTSDLLTRTGPDALRAQQLVAALAVIALEQPNRTRGVVINTPLLWNVALDRVLAVIAGLRDHPLLQGAPVSDLFRIQAATTANSRPYTRTLAPAPVGSAPISASEYAATERDIAAMASMIGTDQPIVGRLRAQLQLTLASRVPGTGPSVSRARVRQVDAAVGSITGAVTTRASRSVTLTSRRASVPLSIENTARRPLKIRVSLASQKLEFPDGADQIVDLPPGNTTMKFDVEARASGTFPVLVTVGSPDGRLDLQRARYTVRSSGVSGVGLVLTIGAGLFLAAWWLTHWRRSRRNLAPALSP